MNEAEYRVSLDAFAGPLDLLLFLVRKEEVDIHDIPISRILEQYLGYLEIIQQLDLDEAGEFLVMASTLMVIKSRMLLPTEEVDLEEEIDPRYELVQQLLEYKKLKDSTELLAKRAERYGRMAPRPEAYRPRPLEAGERELEETSLFDLLAAFQKVMESIGEHAGRKSQRVRIDDLPVSHYVGKVRGALEREGSLLFTALLEGRRHRQEVIGMFLALLLLLKQEEIVCVQTGPEDIRIIHKGTRPDDIPEGEDFEEFA